MKKGKKKWLTAGAVAVAAILAVVQPELVPVIPVVAQLLGVPLPGAQADAVEFRP